MSACAATTRRGQPCRFPARKDTDLCINHEPGARTADASRRAASASAAIRNSSSADLLRSAMALTDRPSIQAVIDTVIRLQFAGRISDTRARTILRGCQLAIQNFDAPTRTMEGIKPQQHPWPEYFERVHGLLSTVGPLLDEAAERDAKPTHGGAP